MRAALHCVAYEWYANGVIDITRVRQTRVLRTACVVRGTWLIFVRLNPVERLHAMGSSRLSSCALIVHHHVVSISSPVIPSLNKSRRPPRFREADGSPSKQILDAFLCNESLSSLLAFSSLYLGVA